MSREGINRSSLTSLARRGPGTHRRLGLIAARPGRTFRAARRNQRSLGCRHLGQDLQPVVIDRVQKSRELLTGLPPGEVDTQQGLQKIGEAIRADPGPFDLPPEPALDPQMAAQMDLEDISLDSV